MADVTANTRVAAQTPRYTAVAIALHWIIAVLILGQIAGGLWMSAAAKTAGPEQAVAVFNVYQLHKTFGLLVLVLSLGRLAWRIMNPPPAPPAMAAWQKICAEAVHYAFYGLMIAIPLTGWLMVSASPREVPTLLFNSAALPWPHLPFFHGLAETGREAAENLLKESHEILAFLTVGLLFIHVGAALKHHVADRDGLIARMAPRLAGPTTPPRAPRGLAIAAAVILAPLVLGVAGGRLMARAGAGEDDARALAPAAAVGAHAWAVDYEASALTFTLAYQDRELAGEIGSWTADITFNPDDLENSAATVRLRARSVETADGYVNGLIPGNDGLRAEEHPEVTFRTTGFRDLGDGAYEADVAITLRGVTRPATFPFTLALDGDEARMSGRLVFDRLDFDLGRVNDPGGAYLGPEIIVNADVTARRAQ